jgi:hypothetical protein
LRNAQPKRGKAAPLADPFISNVTCWTYTGRRLYDNNMKFIEPRPVADPDAAARKLLELANAFEPIQDGRIYIEKINWPFLSEFKGSPAEYSAGLKFAIERGCRPAHSSFAFS